MYLNNNFMHDLIQITIQMYSNCLNWNFMHFRNKLVLESAILWCVPLQFQICLSLVDRGMEKLGRSLNVGKYAWKKEKENLS